MTTDAPKNEQYNETTVRCGCGDYAVDIDSRKHICSVDIICPKCNNHFGWDAPEDEFRESRGTEREDREPLEWRGMVDDDN